MPNQCMPSSSNAHCSLRFAKRVCLYIFIYTSVLVSNRLTRSSRLTTQFWTFHKLIKYYNIKIKAEYIQQKPIVYNRIKFINSIIANFIHLFFFHFNVYPQTLFIFGFHQKRDMWLQWWWYNTPSNQVLNG